MQFDVSDFPVYHTAYDTYDWMVNHGDPLFQRHVAGEFLLAFGRCVERIRLIILMLSAAGVWGLLALRLADDLILPFNYLSYANQLQVCRTFYVLMKDHLITFSGNFSGLAQEFAIFY